MKFLQLMLLVFTCSFISANEKNKVVFHSTFKKGFGIVFKSSVVIKKVKNPPNSKIPMVRYYAISVSGKKIKPIRVKIFAEHTRPSFVKLFTKKDEVELNIIGFESIDSYGSPSLGVGVESHEAYIPAGLSWQIMKVCYLMSFSEK